MTRAAAPLIATLLLVLTGCGDGSGDSEASDPASPTDSPSADASPTDEPESESPSVPADAPTCDEVWVAGHKIPRGYKGCVDRDGGYVQRDSMGCSSGQRLVKYADRFFGVVGGEVHQVKGGLDQSKEYLDTVKRCRG